MRICARTGKGKKERNRKGTKRQEESKNREIIEDSKTWKRKEREKGKEEERKRGTGNMANELERKYKERKRKERGTEERKGKNERKERKKKHGRGIREEMTKKRRGKGKERGKRWWSGLGCLQNFDFVCCFVVALSRITDKNHLSQESRQKEKNRWRNKGSKRTDLFPKKEALL